MLVQNDSDIIMIDVNVFKENLNSLNKQNIPKSLLQKRHNLYNNYKCFQSKFETQINQHVDKKYFVQFKHRETPKPSNRLHIISTNFDDITNTKKGFISNLNKLSPINKNNIFPKIKDIIHSISDDKLIMELYNTVWEFIKKSYDVSYFEVLNIFDKRLTTDNWKTYTENKCWYPDDYILNNMLLSTDENMYDMYCKYVSWKKGVSNFNKTWCLIHSNNNSLNLFDVLLNDIVSIYLLYANKTKTHKHIIDFALEQMLIILKVYQNPYFINLIKTFDVSKLESSSKFIILDICDLI
jgi:hypothetical protein